MKFKNKYGQVTLQQESNIIIANFSGYINESLMRDLSKELTTKIKALSGSPWGYISNSLALEAATPEAEKNFIDLTIHMVKEGCIASAYILGSTLVTNQMQRIVKNSGLELDIRDYIFNNVIEAKSYINAMMTEPTTF